MSQSIPPNDPREPGPGANPYYQAQPDLDAATPVLKAEDTQRLNRKAFVFLGGTLALVLLMAVLLLRSGGGDEGPVQAPRQEQVSVPAIPRNVEQAPLPLPQSVPPIPLVLQEEPIEAFPPPLPAGAGQSGNVKPAAPSLLDRRIADAGGGTAGSGSGATAAASSDTSLQQALAAVSGGASAGAGGSAEAGGDSSGEAKFTPATRPSQLQNADVKMVRGTYLRCVLETRIITDLQGFSSCVITEPVYSVNGRRLLVPKGSKVYGAYGEGAFVNDRVAVVWDRILTPQGVDITISAPGVDNLGSSGIPGQYDAHWARRISSALMISLLSDAFKFAAAENGPQQVGVTAGGFVTQQPFESNTARSIQRLAEQAIDENSRRPPTVTINQGSMINIYVTQDIDFSGVLPQG